jgi:acyl carrier protein
MNTEEFLANFLSNIEVTDTSMTLDTQLSDIPQWDSLALLATLAMVDGEYGVQINGVELQACASIGDIARIVALKLP